MVRFARCLCHGWVNRGGMSVDIIFQDGGAVAMNVIVHWMIGEGDMVGAMRATRPSLLCAFLTAAKRLPHHERYISHTGVKPEIDTEGYCEGASCR